MIDTLSLPQLAVWIISLASIACMLVRPRGIPEWVWICGGAGLLTVTRLLSFQSAAHAVAKGLDVYLFLTGMMLLAALARLEGVFDWIAGIAVRSARGSASRLFLLVYLAGTIVTALLSNDATAVVLTPAVLAAVRRAKANPRPHLLACALIANAASFVLPISNPANLVVYGKHLPALGAWLRIFALPSLAAIAMTFVCLRLWTRSDLQASLTAQPSAASLSPKGKLALGGLVLSAVTLTVASAVGWDLGLPTFLAALSSMLMMTIKDRTVTGRAVQDVSWSILPLVAGLFILVEALGPAGLERLAHAAFVAMTQSSHAAGSMMAAFGVALLSNVMNNLPVGLATGSALGHTPAALSLSHAALIGVDLGPNLSVTGSLATILWLIALRREGVEITAWEFLKIGAIAMPVALAASIGALLLTQ